MILFPNNIDLRYLLNDCYYLSVIPLKKANTPEAKYSISFDPELAQKFGQLQHLPAVFCSIERRFVSSLWQHPLPYHRGVIIT